MIEPEGVRRYLESKFGEHLNTVRKAMERLARSYDPIELAERAFDLYERFRPEIPCGRQGLGCMLRICLVGPGRLAATRGSGARTVGSA